MVHRDSAPSGRGGVLLPESTLRSVAGNLGLRPEEVRAIVRSGALQDGSSEAIRRLADACSWTYNETRFNVERVRRWLVELGLLDDLRTLQDLRYGPPAESLQAEGRIASVTVERKGRPDERVTVSLRAVPFRFFYSAGAAGYPEVKEALLAGGEVRIWSHLPRAAAVLPIRQLERDGKVLIWYADTAPYFDSGRT